MLFNYLFKMLNKINSIVQSILINTLSISYYGFILHIMCDYLTQFFLQIRYIPFNTHIRLVFPVHIRPRFKMIHVGLNQHTSVNNRFEITETDFPQPNGLTQVLDSLISSKYFFFEIIPPVTTPGYLSFANNSIILFR